MRTALRIDDAALAEAMRAAPGKTKTEVVNEALREYARRRRNRSLLDFRGRLRWEGKLDDLRGRERSARRGSSSTPRPGQTSSTATPRRAFEDLTFLEPPLTQYELIEARAEGTVSDGVAPRPEPG